MRAGIRRRSPNPNPGPPTFHEAQGTGEGTGGFTGEGTGAPAGAHRGRRRGSPGPRPAARVAAPWEAPGAPPGEPRTGAPWANARRLSGRFRRKARERAGQAPNRSRSSGRARADMPADRGDRCARKRPRAARGGASICEFRGAAHRVPRGHFSRFSAEDLPTFCPSFSERRPDRLDFGFVRIGFPDFQPKICTKSGRGRGFDEIRGAARSMPRPMFSRYSAR